MRKDYGLLPRIYSLKKGVFNMSQNANTINLAPVRLHVYFSNEEVIDKFLSIPKRKRSNFIENCILYYLEHGKQEPSLTREYVESIINEKFEQCRAQYLSTIASQVTTEIDEIQTLVKKAEVHHQAEIAKITSSIYDL